MAAMAIHAALFINSLEAREEAQKPVTMGQKEAEQKPLTMMDMYGCESLIGVYEYPYNTMSQDWGSDDVKGFYYHEITESCKAAGGTMPTIMQVYTYIICKQAGVDYEMVFALIEKKSMCRWDAYVESGASVGLMQVSEKWHEERMKKLRISNLQNPFNNVRVGVDYLKEIQESIRGSVPDQDLTLWTIAIYNHGRSGAKAHYADGEAMEIVERMNQLKAEKKGEEK